MEMEQMLRALCAVGAPSGYERPAVLAAKELLEPLVDEVWIDRLGSLVGVRRCGKPGAKKLLLDAHLDEVGLVVTGMQDGFLRFKASGVDVRMLPDREVSILTDPPMLGVVACLPPHVLSAVDREKAAEIKDLYVDTGLSQEEAERKIPVGTPVVYRTDFTALGEGQLCSKAMDDRACFAAVLRAVELLQGRELDVDLYILGSVCEETGGAGAQAAVQGIAPDCCVAVDVTHGRTPDAAKDETFVMGGGPVVGIGPNMAQWMVRRLLDQAEKMGLAVQKEVMEGSSGTNGWEMQIANEGIATAVLSVPLKYMHTPVEVVEPEDLESCARLLAAFVENLGEEGAQ